MKNIFRRGKKYYNDPYLITSECTPGTTGWNCSQTCLDGYHGRECREQCPSQCNKSCDKVSGVCPDKGNYMYLVNNYTPFWGDMWQGLKCMKVAARTSLFPGRNIFDKQLMDKPKIRNNTISYVSEHFDSRKIRARPLESDRQTKITAIHLHVLKTGSKSYKIIYY